MAGEKVPVLASSYSDADGTETIEIWECEPGCPVAAFDAQTGERPGAASNGKKAGTGYHSGFGEQEQTRGRADKGSGSRMFPRFDWQAEEDDPILAEAATRGFMFYATKAARKEREEGLGRTGKEVLNKHPTVKPIAVMRWLCKLVTPPGGVVVDPFLGSGTTGIAAVLEGFRFLGIEREPEYLDIAQRRIAHHAQDPS